MKRRSWWGIGPKAAIPTVIYLVASWALSWRFPDPFVMRFAPPIVWRVAGGVLVLLGMVSYFWMLRYLAVALQRASFIRSGPYALVRHPLYAAWLILILPGTTLFSQSWLVMLTPFVFYVSLCLFIAEEEKSMREEFGEVYEKYMRETPRFFPITILRKISRSQTQ